MMYRTGTSSKAGHHMTAVHLNSTTAGQCRAAQTHRNDMYCTLQDKQQKKGTYTFTRMRTLRNSRPQSCRKTWQKTHKTRSADKHCTNIPPHSQARHASAAAAAGCPLTLQPGTLTAYKLAASSRAARVPRTALQATPASASSSMASRWPPAAAICTMLAPVKLALALLPLQWMSAPASAV
jgi:hypothetical protein